MISPLLKVTARQHLLRLRSERHRLRPLLTLVGMALVPTLIVVQTHEMFRMWLFIPEYGVEFLRRFLSFTFLGIFLLLLFGGVSSALHHFYMADDLRLLLPLPLSERLVYTVKFIEIFLGGLPTFVAFGLPLMVSLAMALNVDGRMLLVVPAALFWIMIAVGLSSLFAIGLARLFYAPRLRRSAVFVYGILIVSGWAWLQFLRLDRLNPASLDFDLQTAVSFSKAVAKLHTYFLPSDRLISAMFSVSTGDWRGLMLDSTLMSVGAFGILWLTIILRARIKFDLTECGLAARRSRRLDFGRLQLPLTLFLKELKLVGRDMRTLHSYLLFAAVILVWPFLQKSGTEMPMQTFGQSSAYLPLLFIAVTAAVGMARQSVPIEGRSFQYVRCAATAVRLALLAKAAVHLLLLSIVVGISVIITARRLELSGSATAIISAAMSAFVCLGVSVGLFCGARCGRFDWSDPRHMLSVSCNYLSLLAGWVVASVGAAILAAGFAAGRSALAFFIFFIYVCSIFWASIFLSERRLTRFDWL